VSFTKQPKVDTYSTKTVPLVHQYNSRAGTLNKDVDYINVFFESMKNRDAQEQYVDIYTRPGYTTFSGTLQSTAVRRVFFWEAQNKWYVWVDDDIQIVDATGTVTATITGVLGTSTGDVGVTEFLYDDGTVKLVFTDGVSLKTIDSANTVVASADADLPTPIKTSIVFLDGYLFIVDADTNDIVNSNLNDPLAYTAGDFISAEMLPDAMVAIARVNNYLVAFGRDSIEYFWDAANASGSPLQRNDTPVKLNGLLSPKSIAQCGNKVLFLGSDTETLPSVFILEDFKMKEISTEAMKRQLGSLSSAYADYHGVVISLFGHDFYILTGPGGHTFVTDIENPTLWSRWKEAGQENLFVRYGTTAKHSSASSSVFYVHGKQVLYIFDGTITTDAGTSYTWSITTPNESFDSYNQKVINRLTVVADRPSADTTMTVAWSDDDYQTWQTGQTLNLNQELPCIYQLGSFRRRAFKLTCTPTVPFRVRQLEVDINLGNS
jgi:hypothetical protein